MKQNKIIRYIFIILLLLTFNYAKSHFTDSYGLKENQNVSGDLVIYFLDVGQADSILVQNDGENMLIDAGNNADGKGLIKYFESLDIDTFKYVFGTHAHEDHIGGLDDIINNFNIDNFYMPDVVTTTATFEDILDSLENKNLEFKVPEIGDVYELGDAKIFVKSVGDDESNLNDTSIVLKIEYGDNSVLFTGDASTSIEKNILDSDIASDVLKIGHHGSQYSSSKSFLKAVNPKYAIISCGKNNSYGHPTDKVLNYLNDLNIKIYRTDEDGTIKMTSDGTNINFETIKTEIDG